MLALDNQLEWYTDIIERNPNYIEVGRYIDEGITGTSAKKRDGFMRMIQDAKKGVFDLIITREVSRFARNTLDTIEYVNKLKEFGVVVHFIGDGIRTDDPDGEFRLTLMAGLAQDESRKISQRVKYGITMARQKGVLYRRVAVVFIVFCRTDKKRAPNLFLQIGRSRLYQCRWSASSNIQFHF